MPRQLLLFIYWNPFSNPYFLFLDIQFFDSTPFFPTKSVGYLPFTVQQLCDLQDIMPHYWSSVLSTQSLPKEAEDFPSNGNHSKHVPLLTHLA